MTVSSCENDILPVDGDKRFPELDKNVPCAAWWLDCQLPGRLRGGVVPMDGTSKQVPMRVPPFRFVSQWLWLFLV